MKHSPYVKLSCAQIKALAEFFDLGVTEKEGFNADRKVVLTHAEIPAFPESDLPKYSGLIAYEEDDMEASQYGVLQLED